MHVTRRRRVVSPPPPGRRPTAPGDRRSRPRRPTRIVVTDRHGGIWTSPRPSSRPLEPHRGCSGHLVRGGTCDVRSRTDGGLPPPPSDTGCGYPFPRFRFPPFVPTRWPKRRKRSISDLTPGTGRCSEPVSPRVMPAAPSRRSPPLGRRYLRPRRERRTPRDSRTGVRPRAGCALG